MGSTKSKQASKDLKAALPESAKDSPVSNGKTTTKTKGCACSPCKCDPCTCAAKTVVANGSPAKTEESKTTPDADVKSCDCVKCFCDPCVCPIDTNDEAKEKSKETPEKTEKPEETVAGDVTETEKHVVQEENKEEVSSPQEPEAEPNESTSVSEQPEAPTCEVDTQD